jgi:hypothetical protein
VEPNQVTVRTKQVSFRRVYWSLPTVNCPRCGRDAPRVWDITRGAVDIDLDQPIVLAVEVSVHVCAICSRMFRAQPPFLRPRSVYTRRVVQKAIDAVYRDGLAARCVPDHLARDFWIKPDEKMVRLWCRAYAATIDFAVDYQPWLAPSWNDGLRSGQTTWATDGRRRKQNGDTRSGVRTLKRRRSRRCVANNSTWMPIISSGSAPSFGIRHGNQPTMPLNAVDASFATDNTHIFGCGWSNPSRPI